MMRTLTRAGVLGSRPVLQGLQATDHGLDAGAHLLVLMHERGALAGEGLVALTQRAVLVLQVLERREQFFDALGEPRQFGIELVFL